MFTRQIYSLMVISNLLHPKGRLLIATLHCPSDPSPGLPISMNGTTIYPTSQAQNLRSSLDSYPQAIPTCTPLFHKRHPEHQMVTEKKLTIRKRYSQRRETFHSTTAQQKSSRTKLFSVKKGKFSTYAIIFKRMYLCITSVI